jgi:hypothetical protein
MIEDVNSLPDDPVLLKKLLAKQAARLMFLEEQFRLAQQQRFGASSESHPAQGDLFNEAEAELDVVEEENEPAPTIAKKKPIRKKLPSDLPREIIIHDIEDKTCDCCGNALHQMGDERSEKLEFIPAQVKVIEHVRLKYSCLLGDN